MIKADSINDVGFINYDHNDDLDNDPHFGPREK
jgi:hypothetical protein